MSAGLGGSHLGCEHVHDPIHRPAQQKSPHQEANQDHVGEERAEVHHLRARGMQRGHNLIYCPLSSATSPSNPRRAQKG